MRAEALRIDAHERGDHEDEGIWEDKYQALQEKLDDHNNDPDTPNELKIKIDKEALANRVRTMLDPAAAQVLGAGRLVRPALVEESPYPR